MATILIEKDINMCNECPFCKKTNQSCSDDWDRMEDWECTKMPAENKLEHKYKNNTKGKVIAKAVEWMDKPEVPNWCPILKIN